MHYKQHEKYPDFNVKKLCKLGVPSASKWRKDANISYYKSLYWKFLFLYLWVSVGNTRWCINEEILASFPFNKFQSYLCLFSLKNRQKVSETITRDRLQLIYSFFFKLEDKLINICERNHLWYGFEIDWFVFLQQTMWNLQTVQPLHRFTGCSYIRLLHKCRLVGETTVLYHPATVWVLHNGAHIVYKCQR